MMIMVVLSVEIGDLKPDPALWHEDNGRKPWENRRQDPPGSISGWHLGDAAHRLVANSLQLRANRNGYSNEEKKMCVKSAEVANQKHLEGKKLPGPTALAQMKLEVENLGRDYRETRVRRSPLKPRSPHPPQLPDFSLDSVPKFYKENDFLAEHFLAMEKETKMLKKALALCTSELQASRNICAKTVSKLQILESQLHANNQQKSPSKSSLQIPTEGSLIQSVISPPSFTSMSEDGNDNEKSCAGSWATTSISGAYGLPDPQSNIDPLPLMKFQMRISMLFESTDADMKKILDDIRCVVQETQDSLHHHTMGCVFMESHCSDATCDRQACLEGTEVTEEKEMSLSKDSSINEELVAAVSWIHDFVLVLGNEATAVQGTSPDGDVLSQKIQKFSATFDKVISSELHFNVLGYKNNEAETNCSYCIDKVVLPENKVVRDTLGDRYSNGCAHFSDSASDHEGSFISTFESNATTWKCLLKEFEQLKLEKDNMALDLESTKAQLQGTEQLLAKVKSQLASAQKLNSLAAEMCGRVIQEDQHPVQLLALHQCVTPLSQNLCSIKFIFSFDLTGSFHCCAASRAPPPAPVQGSSGGSMLGSLGSTIAQGMAFGTGSAVAHRAVDAVMGPRTIQHETVASEAAAAPASTTNSMGSDACNVHSKAFQDCLNGYGNDISKCQFYMDMLTECRRNSGSMMGA
ncbi:hypothetical protein TEA_014354 [Camellia sinensis var. sinensis]|uniref:CHCH domain-containing protein n=1 Tax=Camellia sinensis var. sinensis TaxID=542762 RepID=A0A4S4DS52_CAMSN|nr:hypothetical protein TEA_014354 [Camellia sinensis var. sinensis]